MTSQNVFRKLTLVLGVIVAFTCFVKGQDKPNILWIVSEDNSVFLGSYGDKFATTPFLDKFATEGIRFTNVFSPAPVCAPSRNALITGVYPPSYGTENMRSTYKVPDYIRFYPSYLKEAGYYTSNNAKKDYNTVDQPSVWDESSLRATYKNRKKDQPFFAVFNLNVTHESSIHQRSEKLRHAPERVTLPPYHPDTEALRKDWAQYYDKLEEMDRQVEAIVGELKEEGLYDNTIIFYFSDNGGVLARSKRFLYESGLHVPLIVRIPEKYRHLAPGPAGSTSNRLITFVDFAPTLLNLLDIPVPAHFQGFPFLGEEVPAEPDYAFSFRGRMDERIDLSRTVRDKRFRYVRHYYPGRIYGQHLDYLWKAESVRSLEEAFLKGELNEIQSRFWNEKPSEELFDVLADPHNVRNLATDPAYSQDLIRLREANRRNILEKKDVGLVPEAIAIKLDANGVLRKYAEQDDYPLSKILNIAEKASERNQEHLEAFAEAAKDAHPVVRYWAAVGFGFNAEVVKNTRAIESLLGDPEPAVKIAAAESLLRVKESEEAWKVLTEILETGKGVETVQALNSLYALGKRARKSIPQVRKIVDKGLPAGTPGQAIPADTQWDIYAYRAAVGLQRIFE